MRQFSVRAECGAIRIFAGPLACQFHGGSGDGYYKVRIYDKGETFVEEGMLWKFVDSFEVADGGMAYLSGCDWENVTVAPFGPGRWFVSHQRDEHLVVIEFKP